MLPHQINEAARLVLIAESRGAEVLDDPARFDNVVRGGRFAELDSEALSLARRVVKSRRDGVGMQAVDVPEMLAEGNQQKLG